MDKGQTTTNYVTARALQKRVERQAFGKFRVRILFGKTIVAGKEQIRKLIHTTVTEQE